MIYGDFSPQVSLMNSEPPIASQCPVLRTWLFVVVLTAQSRPKAIGELSLATHPPNHSPLGSPIASIAYSKDDRRWMKHKV